MTTLAAAHASWAQAPRWVALACLTLGLWLASAHPLSPAWAVVAVLGAAALTAWRPQALAWVLPALLPVASLMPWTGWWLLDGSDLLVLALAAGVYARWPRAESPPSRLGVWLWLATAAIGLLGVLRAASDAPVPIAEAMSSGLAWLSTDHTQAWNTLRVSKAVLWCLLLAPLWGRLGAGMSIAWCRGMVAGLALVCAGVFWERAALVGLFNVSDTYRTSSWFWEMQVGGGAIDMYLAMALPFALWALWCARPGWPRWLALLLWWCAVYAVFTTFSRGIVLVAGLLLCGAAVLVWRSGEGSKRRGLLWWAASAVLVQAVWIAAGGFLTQRLERAELDLRQRFAHWQAMAALPQGAADVLLGIGAGRLPARYDTDVPGGELPGRAALVRDADGTALVLSGPRVRADLAGRWAFAQRVGVLSAGPHLLRVRASGTPDTVLRLGLCERHLLDARACRWRDLDLAGETTDGWHSLWLPAAAEQGRWPLGVLELRSPGPGQHIRVQAIELFDPQGRAMLRQPDFRDGTLHWMGIAQGYYQPWHADNLLLELWVERGVLGLVLAVALVVWGVRGLWPGVRSAQPQAWVFAAAVAAVLVLGNVISITENPRLLLLGGVLLCISAHKRSRMPDESPCKRL